MTHDAPPEFWLRRNFEQLGLSSCAIEWLLMLWQAMQVIDDIVDGDPVTRDDGIMAGFNMLCAMPGHPFFQRNSTMLLPVMALQYAKWKASDDSERAGERNAMSFVWRAGYYDVVMLCVQIEHGTSAAMDIGQSVMALYGETYGDYLKEASNA
jgi:hypothetical protein